MVECIQHLPGIVAVITDYLPYHISVLLFDIAVIILLVGARASEGDMFPPAIDEKMLVNKFTTIVRIES